MKKLFTLFLISNLFTLSGFAQTPGLQWQRSLGGSNNDIANFSFKTSDGGMIMVGSTFSGDGHVTGYHGGEDVWVVKMNRLGSIEWSKSLGGSGNDVPADAVYKNGFLVIASNSNSTNGNITNNHGGNDIWVTKLDSLGNLIWQNSYGGSGSDFCYNLIPVSSGGYAMAGYTSSNNGDVTGNHGLQDLWILRFSDAGGLQWQKALGGSANEFAEKVKIIETKTGGSFLVASETYSTDGNVSGSKGQSDAWVVKLSSLGNLIWQTCLGGASVEYLADLKEAPDGEIFVLSRTRSFTLYGFHGTNTSYSDIYLCRLSSAGSLVLNQCYGSFLDDVPHQLMILADGNLIISADAVSGTGDVSGFHGFHDIWMLKISPALGVIWKRSLGGSDADGIEGRYGNTIFRYPLGSFIKTNDQGFLITGYTETQNNGDVSGYHSSPNTWDTTKADVWVVKLNSTGVLEWQKTIGGSRGEWSRGAALEVAANEYIITAYTNSNDFDISSAQGQHDALVIRLGAVNTIKGTVFVDGNSNGIKDKGEPFYSNASVSSKKPNDSANTFSYNGLFINEVDTGTYTTTLKVSPAYYNILPVSKSSTFLTYFNTDSFSLALQPIPNKKDLSISIIPVTPSRPGFSTTYRILYNNAGTTTIPSGEVVFKKDTRLSLISASPAATTTGDTLKWNYANLQPGDTASIFVNFTVAPPPTVNINDTLVLTAFINPVAGDETPANDTAILKQRVIGSFDPNDKTESNEGLVPMSFITKGSNLQYLIRFQNTGSDTAFNITVRDTLSARVDAATLQMVAASYPYTLIIEKGNILTWQFKNILLPDSTINEPASHGYIVYTVRPKADVATGETIHNTASIYFDFNLPVLTNDAPTLVKADLAVLPQGVLSFYGNRQGQKVALFWKMASITGLEKFGIEKSTDGVNYTLIGNAFVERSRMNYFFTDPSSASSPSVFYRLAIVAIDGSYKYSNVLNFRKESDGSELVVSPNPVTKNTSISFKSTKAGKAEIHLLNAAGSMISRQQVAIVKGVNVYAFAKSGALAPGTYFVRLIDGEIVKAALVVVK